MKSQNLSPDEWRQNSPDDEKLLQAVSEYKFFKDGTVHFQLRSSDNSVIKNNVYEREDKTNRQNQGWVFPIHIISIKKLSFFNLLGPSEPTKLNFSLPHSMRAWRLPYSSVMALIRC